MTVVSNAFVVGYMKLGMTADDGGTPSMSFEIKARFEVAFRLFRRSANKTLAKDV